MSHQARILGATLSVLILTALGCSLVGRVVDQATGGAVSTVQSLQSEIEEAVATLPAEIPGGIPSEIPGEIPDIFPLLTQVAPDAGTGGTITGSLTYPSEGIPPLKVVAFDVLSQIPAATVETQAGQSTYSLSVPFGAYYLVAYTLDGRLAGGYTTAVLCGLSADCTDHMLIPVPVAPGFSARDIDPADWYAPEGTFPPIP